jgi:hypothetical protein
LPLIETISTVTVLCFWQNSVHSCYTTWTCSLLICSP